MSIDGTVVAAIVTGILALLGVLATAWMSGWNAHRIQGRANKKALARHSVPLVNAAWDLTNWLFDILDEDNYSTERCAAYGAGWSSQFTSYLLGQYFASVHIIREMIHFFPHIRGEEVEKLKNLLWKIQDEFVSTEFRGRESLEMRWFEGDILAAQEHSTELVYSDGVGTDRELRTIGWVEFQKKYAPAFGPGNADSPELYKLFGWYEDEIQRIIYRKFKSLYTSKWPTGTNPQAFETLREQFGGDEEKIKKLEEEEERIRSEQENYPNINVIVPDHRVRRLQHLLSNLVVVLDSFTAMKLNRPIRKCRMLVETNVSPSSNPLGLIPRDRIPCDCDSIDCNPIQEDFPHRQLARTRKTRLAWRKSSYSPRRSQVQQMNAPLERKGIVETSKV